MKLDDSNRRNFGKLTVAAVGGLMAGAATATGAEQTGGSDDFPVDPSLLLKEPHVCRGLNTCKGHGAGGGNACGGQGSCASVAKHSCNGSNDCKGQGGCGGYPGQNACKGTGECATPLNKQAWALARKQFEYLMNGLGKKFGDAPSS